MAIRQGGNKGQDNERLQVGIIGATGMSWSEICKAFLENHPWFRPVVLAASIRSQERLYEKAVWLPLGDGYPHAGSRWLKWL